MAHIEENPKRKEVVRMYKHQELFLNTTQEYTRQINQLLDMAKGANREQIKQLSSVLGKLNSSLQKLTGESEKFKRYINNPVKYKAMLQPYMKLLEETRAEIERMMKNEPKH